MSDEMVPVEAASAKKKGADPVAVESFELTLDEFCLRLSSKKIGPELIGGFHHAMVAGGKFKTSESAYQALFTDFSTQPV